MSMVLFWTDVVFGNSTTRPEVKFAGDPESASDVHYIIYGTNEPHRTREFLGVPLCGLRIRSRKGLIHRGFASNFSRFSIQPVF